LNFYAQVWVTSSRPVDTADARFGRQGLARAVAIGAAYFGLAELGFALPLEAQGMAAFWLGAGLSLGFLARLPAQKWPPVLIAVFVACFASNLLHHATVALSLSFSLINVVEPILGARLMRKWKSEGETPSLVARALALALAGGIAAFAGALLGTSTLIVAGRVDSRISTFLHWFVEDWLGILVVAPLILAWWPGSDWSIGRYDRRQRLELAALLLAVCLTGYFTFWNSPSYGISLFSLFGLLALMLIGGITLGPRGATLAGVCVACFATIGTLSGRGTFMDFGDTLIDHVTGLQGYMLVTVLVGLLPAVLLGDRAKIVEKLRQREQEVEAIFQSLGEALIVTDAAGIITYVNRAGISLLAADRSEIVNRPFHQTVALEAAGDRPDVTLTVMQTERVFRSPEPSRLLRADGSETWISITGAPLTSAEQDIRGVAVILNDENTRRSHANRLAEAERRLAHAQRVRAIGDLAAGVAHDFNNLLMIISASTELLLQDGQADPELVTEILEACSRAKKLTAKLTVLSRDDVEDFQALDANALVDSIRGMLVTIAGADIAIHVEPSTEPEPVLADRTHLEQVLFNLVLNARDAMSRGGTITIRIYHQVPAIAPPDANDREFVVIEVQDTGHGIDPQTQERIFEPFFSTKPAGAGTGLGLAAAQAICSKHHGYLDVRSSPGYGSTFRIHLPRMENQHKLETLAIRQEEVQGSGQQVLVVDDNLEIGESIRRMLFRAGFHVTVAQSPAAALEMLAHRHFDILLSDVIMPEMNGKELAKRALQIRPTQQILFMTGYSAGLLGQRIGGLDEFPVIRKPFTAADLSRTILRQLATPVEASIPAPA
jgi:PAS domain S-box-containing protein